MCCSKLILFISNALLFVFGIFVIASASVVISKSNDYGNLLDDGVFTLPIVILTFGIFICILGFLGCFGAIKESKCMLYTYAGIILVLFFGEIAVSILIIAHPNYSKNVLENSLTIQYDHYDDVDGVAKNSIDNMQTNLECCGPTGPFNYPAGRTNLPPSCCPMKFELVSGCSVINAYPQSCTDAVVAEFKNMTILLGVLGIVMAIFMFWNMSTACGIARKNDYK